MQYQFGGTGLNNTDDGFGGAQITLHPRQVISRTHSHGYKTMSAQSKLSTKTFKKPI
jgi:hypothetical protein